MKENIKVASYQKKNWLISRVRQRFWGCTPYWVNLRELYGASRVDY